MSERSAVICPNETDKCHSTVRLFASSCRNLFVKLFPLLSLSLYYSLFFPSLPPSLSSLFSLFLSLPPAIPLFSAVEHFTEER